MSYIKIMYLYTVTCGCCYALFFASKKRKIEDIFHGSYNISILPINFKISNVERHAVSNSVRVTFSLECRHELCGSWVLKRRWGPSEYD
jgi:hypothetical protein